MIKRHKWGWGITLVGGKQFKIKLLCFESGKAISMQRHRFRSELWLILTGGGIRESLNHSVKTEYRKGEWFWVGTEVWHKFTAIKQTVVIEIQYGDKCAERDIQRI